MDFVALFLLVALGCMLPPASGDGLPQEVENQVNDFGERFDKLLKMLSENGFRGICRYLDKFYLAGESFPASDGCNTCFCSSNGLVGCTRMFCLPEDNCPRGGQLWFIKNCVDYGKPCPPGYYCEKSHKVCCPDPRCPKLNPFIAVLCIMEEKCDEANCKLCCPSYCGTRCEKPEHPPNLLVCPTLDQNPVGICAELCTSDEDCHTGDKCCSTGCGHSCMKGVEPVHPPTHPQCPEVKPAWCLVPEACPEEGCKNGTKCCPSICGEKCTSIRPTSPCEIGPPLTENGQEIFCGRGFGSQPCPADYYCAIAPDDSYAVCCQTP